ncbi:hypothetical protein Bbelb_326450 [Branchiostoma belcheri]|nr:hypothetical protein Bbelb_326450 [Branchiostoma belcheri]
MSIPVPHTLVIDRTAYPRKVFGNPLWEGLAFARAFNQLILSLNCRDFGKFEVCVVNSEEAANTRGDRGQGRPSLCHIDNFEAWSFICFRAVRPFSIRKDSVGPERGIYGKMLLDSRVVGEQTRGQHFTGRPATHGVFQTHL